MPRHRTENLLTAKLAKKRREGRKEKLRAHPHKQDVPSPLHSTALLPLDFSRPLRLIPRRGADDRSLTTVVS